MPIEAVVDVALGSFRVQSSCLKSSFLGLASSFSSSDQDDALEVPQTLSAESQPFSHATNISATQIYDLEREHLHPTAAQSRKSELKALDLGAGAGLSTRVLRRLGYKHVDAVDQSEDAWSTSGADRLRGVAFFHKPANAFVQGLDSKENTYDAVNVAFAIRRQKALDYAQHALAPGGRLLAPIATSDEVEPTNDGTGKVATRFHLMTKDKHGLQDEMLPEDSLPPACKHFQPDVTAFPSGASAPS